MILVHVENYGDAALAYVSPNIWMVLDNRRPGPGFGVHTRHFCPICSQQIRDLAMTHHKTPTGDHTLWCRCMVIGYRPAWVNKDDLLKNWQGFISINNEISADFATVNKN
jgi:hypothetical protein